MPDNPKKPSTNIDKINNDKMKMMNDAADEQRRNYRGASNILKSGNEQKYDSLGFYFNKLSKPLQEHLVKNQKNL